jgi:hypothetical protein
VNNVNIANIAEGALVEQVDAEIKKVLENIMDLNTEPTKKRKITITLVFEPSKDRDIADISFQTKSTLIPIMPGETRIAFDKTATGEIIAEEMKKGSIVGQTQIDYETGEVLEPQVTNKIINIK